MLKLNLINTLAFAGLVLMLGYLLRKVFPVLARLNLPAPVLGGLLVSVAILIARGQDVTLFEFDTTLQTPLMIAFFTTIGFGASVSMLKSGGPQVGLFFVLALGFAVLQNVVGIGVALLFGMDPLFGVLAGSVTLTGGPGTGLSFAPLFEAAGVEGAASIALAMAMAGIVCGALLGGPLSGWLITRHRIPTGTSYPPPKPDEGFDAPGDVQAPPPGDDESAETWAVMRNAVLLLVAMAVGSWLSSWVQAQGITLPPYIGAMLVAALIRNIDDLTGWFGLSMRIQDTIGAVTLSLFLALALMTLKLWDLAGLALPLLVMLAAQIILIVVSVPLVFRLMGRDYEASVMGGGFVGFMLGTTANAMAVMRTLVERYGPAPRAFLVAPMVGAFFIDFANSALVTALLNFLQ
ncbi:MAG TPA: sodium/glutamate symporter [Steroidobacteraceae bacterium]|nr:sodium/glutamate symporter [Steroidobacteraceae bacterium]